MRIIRHVHHTPPELFGSVVALGNFDGVHRGHQAVLQTVQSIAAELNAPSALLTFEPHPVTVLRPEIENLRITSLRHKITLLEQKSLIGLFIVPFTKAFSCISAESFVDELLINTLQVRHIVVGYDFIFGHGRSGNAALLQKKAAEAGIGFTQLLPETYGNTICASSIIRDFLRQGDIAAASSMLGHAYMISGRVKQGEARGRLLGFKTANIALHDLLRPRYGVYAVQVRIEGDDKQYNAIANLGNKPTFNGQDALLEVHIFDFDRDIYGKRLNVMMQEFIRPEQKFNNIDQLVNQINCDIAIAKTNHQTR